MQTEKKDEESSSPMLEDMKRCPFCSEAFCKDNNCSYVHCGVDSSNQFRKGYGCGRAFCFTCGKKYCAANYDQHDATCCTQEAGFVQEEYCEGGHSAHCPKRW